VTTKENYEKALNKVHPYVQAVAKQMACTGVKFLQRDIVSFETFDTHGYTWSEDFSVSFDGDVPQVKDWRGNDRDMSVDDAFEKFQAAVNENKDEVFSTSVDL
jgi:hypothetical protein